MKRWLITLALLSAGTSPLSGVPYFARKYQVRCSHCHVTPPRTNPAGEAFAAAGYVLADRPARSTVPFAVWVSARTDRLRPATGATFNKSYLNRVELISGAAIGKGLSYFVEWRPVSFEAQTDGSLRDRSGRFEDLFLTARGGPWELQVGQFRQIGQVDVSRRVGVSEPLVLASGVPGSPGGTARQVALRGFSPGGRSPAARLARTPAAGDWGLTGGASLVFPGEWSIPLTTAARTNASNEMEWSPKGIVLEAFGRRGQGTAGGHLFLDGDRWVGNLITTGSRRELYWTLALGATRAAGQTRGQWSVESEWHPRPWLGVGTRGENRVRDGLAVAVIPYLNVHFPGTRYTVRLTVERRFQRGRGATFIELATIF